MPKPLKILAPLNGVSRISLVEVSPDLTTFDSLNTWPVDVITGRRVLASRCPKVTLSSQPGTTGTVNMLAHVNGVSSGKPVQSMITARNGSVYWFNGSTWTAATGAQASSISTSRQILAHPFQEQAIIANPSGKPFVFDYDAGTVTTMVESAGTVPDGLTMFAVWNGAMVAAGATDTPHVLYMSRQGDMTDWDFSVGINDTAGAFFSAGEDAGLLRGPITAVIPLTSDNLLVSTVEGLVLFEGHPRQGGVATDVSQTMVIGPTAWCRGPSGEVYFLAPDGLMRIDPGSKPVPVPVSRRAFGSASVQEGVSNFQFSAADYSDPKVTLAYEPRWNGIIIQDRGTSVAWFYDIELSGFHPMSLSTYAWTVSEYIPRSVLSNNGQAALYGSTDALTAFNVTGTESFSVSVTLNPIDIGFSEMQSSLVQSFQYSYGVLAGALIGSDVRPSAGTTLIFGGGADPKDAIRRTNTYGTAYGPQVSITLADIEDNAYRHYLRLAGASLGVKFTLSAATIENRFLFESLTLELIPAGRNRLIPVPYNAT